MQTSAFESSCLSPVPFCWLHFRPPPLLFPQLLLSFNTLVLPIYYSSLCGSTHFLVNQSLLLFFYLVYAFCTFCHAVCDCHLLSFCVLSHFLFIHSLILSYFFWGHTHDWGSYGFQTDVERQHLKRAVDLGQWAHLYLPAVSVPLLSFWSSFFSDLSIRNSAICHSWLTGGPYKRCSEIGMQVLKLTVVYGMPTDAKQQLHFTSLSTPTPSSLHVRITPLFNGPDLIFFLPCTYVKLAFSQ